MSSATTEQPITILDPIIVYGDGAVTQPPENGQEAPLAPLLFDKGYGALNAAYTQAIGNLVDDLRTNGVRSCIITSLMPYSVHGTPFKT